jgi:DNA-binding helix-hairpin-helix protein with protein kinase domain
MLVFPPIGYISLPIFAVFSLWWLVMFLASGHRPERHRRRKTLRARRARLRGLQTSWHAAHSAADTEFKKIQKELRAAQEQIEGLKPLHEAELRKLGRDVRRRQLEAFLQTKFISEARINGIGPGRTATLASYGVETAADVEYNRVLGIPGLDAITTNNLCHWRSDWERRFTVNKSQGVPPAQRQALLLKFAQVRQQLETRLRAGSGTLRAVETRLQARLEQLAPQIDAAYFDLAQAYTDVEIMSPRKLRRL